MSIRVLLVVDEVVRREVEQVGVGGVVRGFFEWAFVWGDVDPHGGGLGACEPDGCTVVVELRSTALFEGHYTLNIYYYYIDRCAGVEF